MSQDGKRNDLVHPPEPAVSHPIIGHGGTAYEGVDASVKMVILSLVIIALILVVSFALTIPIQKQLHKDNPVSSYSSALTPSRVLPPEPRIEVHPWDYYPELLATQERVLHSGGKDAAGREHVPIDRAIESFASKVNIRPDAPPGLTIPGGQGRDFASSLANMPSAYQPPAIQGEIRKNAQPQVTQ